MKQYRCQDCDSLLWSEHARTVGYCPECEQADDLAYMESLDLEERLEIILENSDLSVDNIERS